MAAADHEQMMIPPDLMKIRDSYMFMIHALHSQRFKKKSQKRRIFSYPQKLPS
jgi:hypothetical protein